MKNTFIATLIALTAAVSANAQPRKASPPPPPPQPVVTTHTYAGPVNNELTALLGFNSGAASVGVDYVQMDGHSGIGGYFLMQTEKETNNVKIVPQTMSFGAMYKMILADNAKFKAFVAPGFGLTMAKEVGASTGGGKPSDETLFGASYKIGAQYKFTPAFALGIERTALTNWFNDKVVFSELAIYSVAGTFNF